ncbi:MAG: GNAT family N-acetyltransferase [Tatlockia sp.]|nr:GNAT family N-acetyltransferase [Tatlockia sp.]
MLEELNPEEIITALDNNLKGKFRYFQTQLSAMEVIENPATIIINSHEKTDMFNVVCCNSNQISEHELVETINYFKQRNLPFSWWVGFENESKELIPLLVKNGLKQTEEELVMAISLNTIDLPELPPHLSIKRVETSEEINDFIQVFKDIIPDNHEAKAIENFYKQAESIIISADSAIELYVGYIDNQPISTSSVFFSKDVAGIFDIIASPKIRGMGIGKAMTVTAMKAAVHRGYSICVLTATDDAKFLYTKLGFKPFKLMFVYN